MSGDGEVYRPSDFSDVARLGDAFRSGHVVDLDLEDVDEHLARRVIDFASGMVYVAGGVMSKLGPKRFRLVPPPPPPPPEIVDVVPARLPSLGEDPTGTRIVVPPSRP